MTPEELKERAKPWLTPIAGDSSTGADMRYEPDHASIRDEVAKMDRLEGGDIDWDRVVSESNALLGQRSKDILIGAHAAYGMYRGKGLDGLATGLASLAEMMDAFWDDMFPAVRRERARANAIVWLVEKLTLDLGTTRVGAGDHAAIAALKAAYDRLREVCTARFEAPPGLRALKDDIERLRLSLPAEATATPIAAPAETGAAPTQTADAPAAPPAEAGATPEMAAEPASAPSGANLTEELAKRTEPYIAPIDGGAGQDVRYENEYVDLKVLIANSDDPSKPPVDWNQVVQLGDTILKNQSKDILVASYLAYGLFKTEGLDGLLTGISALTGVIEIFWEEGFPALKRMRARKGALTWLIESVEGPLTEMIPAASEREVLDMLEAAVAKFQSVVYEKYGDDAPAVRTLKGAVERAKMSLPADKPKPPAESLKPTSSAQPAAANQASGPATSVSLGAGPAASLADPEQVGAFLLEIGKSLTSAASKLRTAAPVDPVAYRLLRIGLYLHMPSAPPAQQGAKTGIPAPPLTSATQYETLLKNGNWAALLEESESAVKQHRFWVDLQRYAAVSLGGLGDEYSGARDAVISGTRSLLSRMPELLDLQFVDGTPLCGEATRSWLASEVLTGGGGAGGGGGGGGGEEDEIIAQVQGLAAGGKAPEAIGLIEKSLKVVGSDRARFRLRLSMARASSAGGNDFMARGVFAGLVEEAEERELDEWEPALSAELYEAYLSCLKSLEKSGKPVTQESASVYRRLCRVDPTAAFRVSD